MTFPSVVFTLSFYNCSKNYDLFMVLWLKVKMKVLIKIAKSLQIIMLMKIVLICPLFYMQNEQITLYPSPIPKVSEAFSLF